MLGNFEHFEKNTWESTSDLLNHWTDGRNWENNKRNPNRMLVQVNLDRVSAAFLYRARGAVWADSRSSSPQGRAAVGTAELLWEQQTAHQGTPTGRILHKAFLCFPCSGKTAAAGLWGVPWRKLGHNGSCARRMISCHKHKERQKGLQPQQSGSLERGTGRTVSRRCCGTLQGCAGWRGGWELTWSSRLREG